MQVQPSLSESIFHFLFSVTGSSSANGWRGSRQSNRAAGRMVAPPSVSKIKQTKKKRKKKDTAPTISQEPWGHAFQMETEPWRQVGWMLFRSVICRIPAQLGNGAEVSLCQLLREGLNKLCLTSSYKRFRIKIHINAQKSLC